MSTRAQVSPEYRTLLARCGLSDPAALLDRDFEQQPPAGNWTLLSKPGLGGRQRWRWQPPAGPDGNADVLYVKRYLRSSLSEQRDRLMRQAPLTSRAGWEYRVACRLRELHVDVPRPVAWAQRMWGPFELRSAVVFAAAAGDGLDRVWQRLQSRRAPITQGLGRHDLTVRLARFVAAFHGTGFCHRDLYLCHVFAEIDEQGRRPPRFTLIDLARVHNPRLRRMRWIIKDLAQLDASARQVGASRTDRLRFLRAYLNLGPRAPRVRWYARRIVRKSDWILRRIARHEGRR